VSDVLEKALKDAQSDKSLVEQRIRDLKRAQELLEQVTGPMAVAVTVSKGSRDKAFYLSVEEHDSLKAVVRADFQRQAVALAAVHNVTLEVPDVE